MPRPAAILLALAALAAPAAGADGPVYSVTDISHTFSFYLDGRFARQYLTGRGDIDVRNWGTLAKFDFSAVNLAVLATGASSCPYTPQDVAAVRALVASGGGAAILGDYATFRRETVYHLNDLAAAFGAEFLDRPARKPLAGAGPWKGRAVEFYGGKVLRLARPQTWQVLVRDAAGEVLAARRAEGDGSVLLASRGLFGRRPDAKDAINAGLWRPLLRTLAAGKPADPKRRPRDHRPENAENRQGLEIRYSDYMRPYAEQIFGIFQQCRPVQERILGVPPAKGMLATLILLPTGGGGFSSGRTIGLGTWWGGFPEKRYGMVELIGHEATHSWVLPFAEPMWNEGLATYVGIQIGRELGYTAEAERTLAGWIRGARRHDPDMTKYDLAAGRDVPHVVRMAKPMWIWEQLRKETPDILARYFRAKRRLIDPARRRRYTADDCVAVLSIAAGQDLFDWFRSLGTSVEKGRATVSLPAGLKARAAVGR